MLVDYLYFEPLAESWCISISGVGSSARILLRHNSPRGIVVKKAIRCIEKEYFSPRRIARICHDGGSRYRVWLDDGSFRTILDEGIFVETMKIIGDEAEKARLDKMK